MVEFKQVSADDIDNMRRGRRGRVSYPIIKGFLETNFFLAELDRTGLPQSMQSLTSSLNAYIKSHDVPLKIFQRQGTLYMMRLDIDENGEKIANWGSSEDIEINEITSLDAREVARRFEEEKGNTTK